MPVLQVHDVWQNGLGSHAEARVALRHSRRLLAAVNVFSAMVYPLALTGSLCMLQAYDRVLTWRSQVTPMALAGSVAFLFLVIGLHDPVRTKLLACLGLRLRRYWNHTSPDSQRRAPRVDQGGNRIRQQAESSDQGNDRFFGLFAESKRDLIVERAKVGSGSTQDAR